MTPGPGRRALGRIARVAGDVVRGRRTPVDADARRAATAEERLRLERGRAALAKGDVGSAVAEAEAAERAVPGSSGASALRLAASRSMPIRGRRADRSLSLGDVHEALDRLRALGHADPVLVLYHQPSPDNPFQALLYRRAWANGLAPVPLWNLDDLDRVEALVAGGTRVVLHLHWVNRVTSGAGGEAEAMSRASAFAARLDRAVASGIRIAWTAHNVLPHDTAFEAADTEVRRAIVERASLVHVLAASTPELAAPRYRIPLERTLHVPQPSFRGAYADFVDRDAARHALCVPADAWLIALVGGLRPHKGLDTLLDALDLAAEREPRLRLVVAGSPSRSAATDAFLARAANHPLVSLHARSIPSDDLQLYLRAADAAVLPYTVALNSGVLMLALAFDLPVIAPPLGGIAETIDPDVAVTFEPGNAASLAEAILATRRLDPMTVRAGARRICDAADADLLSDRLMAAIAAIGVPAVPGPAGTP